jgi:pimeloyl-ACP methyl ester carboxylesterase
MRITTDDGVGLVAGVDGEGPGLVLVHGFGGAKEDFTDHVPALARDHTVVVFDHRGHGESDKPDDLAAYSFERLAADVLEVADAVGLPTFRLLGHSMGGMVSRGIVLSTPARVDAFVMMDTSAGPIPGFDAELIEAAAEVALTQGKAALKELLEIAKPLTTPAYERTLREIPGFQAFVDYKFDALSPVMWAALIRAMAYQSDDLPRLAAELRCPLLVLVGEQDKPFVEAASAITKAIPAADLATIRDAGHSPQFENPQAWYDALTKFLASVS